MTTLGLRVMLLVGLAGCQPSIGDHCLQSTDCSTTGDRLCDTSQPNGYCTVFNCGANTCPSNGACVATNPAEVGCPYDDRHSPSRFSRIMCLKSCTADSDCRATEGYGCLAPGEYGALLLDSDRTKKVCLPLTSYVAADSAPDVIAPVCQAAGPIVPDIDASPGFEIDAGVDAGTDSGADADAGDASDAASE